METKEIQKIQGEVEVAVQNTATRYGVRVGSVWYSGFGKVTVGRGAVVQITYSTSNGYTNVEGLRVLEGDVTESFDDEDDAPAVKWDAAQRCPHHEGGGVEVRRSLLPARQETQRRNGACNGGELRKVA